MAQFLWIDNGYPMQITPLHIDYHQYYKDKLVEHMIESDKVVAQKKYDGERCLLHFDHKRHWATSRRISKKTDRFQQLEENLPYLDDIDCPLGYTVLDSECFAKTWAESAGVLHSLPERAKKLQEEGVFMKNAVFDCLVYDGKDIRSLPYEERLSYAKKAVDIIGNERVFVVESEVIHSMNEAEQKMEEYISQGYEGAVVKDMTTPYSQNGTYLKWKKVETVDCIVYGYEMGRGKYSNTIGALKVGYWDPEKKEVVHICDTNPGSDADRENWFKNWDTMKMTVVELKAQEKTKTSLRHPRMSRIRQDKPYTDCTYESIFGDAKE